MSYDISCFPVVPGEDPLQTYEALCERDGEQEPGPPDPEREKRKRAIADALMNKNPALEPFTFQHGEIVAIEGISVEDAQLCYRHIELNGPYDGNGIQITVFDDGVSITMPYWHKGEQAVAAVQEIWEYLRIITSFGFACYDPQLGRVLNLETDMQDVVSSYAGTVTKIDAIFSPKRQGKPWWKFW